MAETETVGPAQVFGDPGEHHVCCDCCAGYCPASDVGVDTLELWRVTINSSAYITDRYAAVRADLIEVDEGDRRFTWHDLPKSHEWTVPEVEPGPSRQPLRPDIVERLLDCGIDIRQGEGGERERQHLFVGGEHVGWVMPCVGDYLGQITLDEVPRIRAYLAQPEGRITVSSAEHPWLSAAIILHEHDRLTAAEAGGPRG